MHSLKLFKYCPKCGSSHFENNDIKSRKCTICGFVYYLNASASTAAFVFNSEGQLLVARRAKEPAKGTLDLPGGFVDYNETAEEAIIRELKEETGLTLSNPEYLFTLPNNYLYSGLNIPTLDLFFRFSVEGNSEVRPADDVAELFFLSPEDIDPEKFGLDSIRKAVALFIK
ncbi:NUDIX domain-containing protein [Bacteroidales bacterium OttesenSCG-928-A17]|nr:NUDIX domain-containing protein [Bacteroidales bacterium OttesenSCG-928-A17]